MLALSIVEELPLVIILAVIAALAWSAWRGIKIHLHVHKDPPSDPDANLQEDTPTEGET